MSGDKLSIRFQSPGGESLTVAGSAAVFVGSITTKAVDIEVHLDGKAHLNGESKNVRVNVTISRRTLQGILGDLEQEVRR